MALLLITIIYLCFIALGLPDSLIASAWPIMHNSIGASLSSAGILTTVISLMTILSSLSFSKLIRRFQTNTITWFSICLTAIALIGYAHASSLNEFILYSIPFGIGAGCIDAALNHYVSLNYTSKHMNWLHAFWGVGATLSPFVMNTTITQFNSWESGFKSIAIIQLIIASLVLLTRKYWSKSHEIETSNRSKHKALVSNRYIIVSLTAFFAYCAFESTLGLWLTTHFYEFLNFPYTLSATATSFYYAGIMLGRFLSGIVPKRYQGFKLILSGITLVALGMISLTVLSNDPNLSLVSTLLMGLGSAPMYPAMLHLTPKLFGEAQSGALIGYQMASAYLSITIMPLIYGYIFEYLSGSYFVAFNALFLILFAISIVRLILAANDTKKTSRNDVNP